MEPKKRGRPVKYSSAKSFLEAVENYFNSISYTHVYRDADGNPVQSNAGEPLMVCEYVRPPTIQALCLHIGIDISTWDNYKDAEKRPDLAPICRYAKSRCEAYSAELLLTREKGVQGVIFNLEVNHGWRDRKEIGVTGEIHGTLAGIGDMSLDEKMRMIAAAAQDITAGGYIEGGDGNASAEEDAGDE